MSRGTDIHVRFFGGAFCIFKGDHWAEECASEDAAHTRLAELRRDPIEHVISTSALCRVNITHGTRDGRRTICGRDCSTWQHETPARLDDPPDCLACNRSIQRSHR